MKIYFVRHGESEANVLHVFSNKDGVHPLTGKGTLQANALAESLKPVHFYAIYSSPVLRAVQTSQILSQELGTPMTITGALREYDVGILEGRSDEEAWHAHRELFLKWRDQNSWNEKIEGGESYSEMRLRFVPFVEQLIARHAGEDVNVLAVSHGGLYLCMLPLIFDNISFDFGLSHPLNNTAVVIGAFSESKRECLRWGDQVPGPVR